MLIECSGNGSRHWALVSHVESLDGVPGPVLALVIVERKPAGGSSCCLSKACIKQTFVGQMNGKFLRRLNVPWIEIFIKVVFLGTTAGAGECSVPSTSPCRVDLGKEAVGCSPLF